MSANLVKHPTRGFAVLAVMIHAVIFNALSKLESSHAGKTKDQDEIKDFRY
jgi:hypothetical protein